MQHKINFVFDTKGGISFNAYQQENTTTHLGFASKLGRDVFCAYTAQKYKLVWNDTEVELSELDIERTVTGTKEALELFVKDEFFMGFTREELIEDYGVAYIEMLDIIPV